MTNFVIEAHAPVELSKEQREGIDEAVANCLAHNILMAGKISLKLSGLVLAGKN